MGKVLRHYNLWLISRILLFVLAQRVNTRKAFPSPRLRPIRSKKLRVAG